MPGPLEDWKLPESFTLLRRRMEGKEKYHGEGTREFIKTLRLLEKHSMGRLHRAVKKAVQNGNLYPRCRRPVALPQGRFQADHLQLGRS